MDGLPTLERIKAFEAQMPWEARVPQRSVYQRMRRQGRFEFST